jgi:hypothetical protein
MLQAFNEVPDLKAMDLLMGQLVVRIFCPGRMLL